MKSLATQATYLGYVVSRYGVATDLGKVSAVADWTVLTNLKELQALVGRASYYRQYCENFAKKAHPLTKLNNSFSKFYWDYQCQDSLYSIKQSLLIVSVLRNAGGDCCITRWELPAVTIVVSHYRTYLYGDELRMKPTMLHFFGCVGELHPWHK